MKSASNSNISPDLIVVGAGIFGLWAARHALLRGERVTVLEKRETGAGASGGFLGALMPHMPDTWNSKKQMQFEGLATIGDAIAALEADTGMDCGFRRCGRLMPMTHEKMIDHAKARMRGAAENWSHGKDKSYSMELLEPGFAGTIAEGWLDETVAPFGATHDTLSARVNPRAYLRALATYVRSDSHGRGEIIEGVEVVAVSGDGEVAEVRLADGSVLGAARVIIANGWEAYRLLAGMDGRVEGTVISGRGVKGQAVLLEHAHDDDRPIIYDNGSYIVPHGVSMGADDGGKPNRIAVGSTSVNNWLPAGLGPADPASRLAGRSNEVHSDHPERAAGVEPARYREGPLPEFREVADMGDYLEKHGTSLSTESFAGELTPDDPMAAMFIEAARTSFDREDTGFLDHARTLCPALRDAIIAERWANIRPRNTIHDPDTGKTGTEPLFAPLDDSERVSVAIGGFKISFGIAHKNSR